MRNCSDLKSEVQFIRYIGVHNLLHSGSQIYAWLFDNSESAVSENSYSSDRCTFIY